MTVIVPGSEDYNRIVNRFPFGGGYDGGGINPGNMYGCLLYTSDAADE